MRSSSRTPLPLLSNRHEVDEVGLLASGTVAQQLVLLRKWNLGDAALVMMMSHCLGRCSFCGADEVVNPPASRITTWERIESVLRQAADLELATLLIGGNEPTTHADFERTLALADELGFEEIQLMTSALLLADLDTARRWRRHRLSSIAVPIYGADRETHEAIVQCDSHAQLLAGLDHAAQLGITVHPHTLALRSTLPHLRELSELVRSRWGARLSVGPVRPKEDRFDYARVAPTLAEVREAIGDVDVSLVGFPLCVGDKPREAAMVIQTYFRTQATGFAEICQPCSDRSGCPGVVLGELARSGSQDLIPRS
jgi:hypothetical protein